MTTKKLLIAFVATFMGTTITPYAQKTTDKVKAMEDSIKVLQMQQKLDSVRRVVENKKTEGAYTVSRIEMPCKALDTDEFITALGVGENSNSEDELRKKALKSARSELCAKWIGYIKSNTQYSYNADGNSDDELDEYLKVAGEKYINQYMSVTCDTLVIRNEPKRTYKVQYLTVQIPRDKIENEDTICEFLKKIYVEACANIDKNTQISASEKEQKKQVFKPLEMQNGQPIYGNSVTFATIWGDATVTTTGTTNIVLGSAKFNATINNGGTPLYNERGFCVITRNYEQIQVEQPVPTINDSRYQVQGTGTGNYSLTLTGISEQIVVCVRAYVMQGTSVIYGDTDYFLSASNPAVTTEPAQNITAASAELYGYISFAGVPSYSDYGFVVSATTNLPTLANSTKVPPQAISNNVFGSKVTGLMPNATLYVRAYVTNSWNTIYGQTITIKIPNS